MKNKNQMTLPVAPKRKKRARSKVTTITEISNRLSRYIKPGTKPVKNVSDFYRQIKP